MRSITFIVAGKRWSGTATTQLCESRTTSPLLVPLCNDAVVDALLAAPIDLLVDVPLYEIIAFFNAVGQRWKSKEYARRRSYVAQLQQYLGYSAKMAEAEADWIALLLCSHAAMHDLVATELGHRHILDRWICREESEVRAFPRGRTLHVLPGNVPISSVVSMLRSLLTKNATIAKASSEDLITPLNLALSFRDVNEDHPVARSVSVVHWPGGGESDAVRRLAREVDVICAWGGQDAVEWATRAARSDAEVIRFGPKRSVGVLAAGADLTEAAEAAAHDISIYDQEGCFSVLQLFVQSPVAPFVEKLRQALALYSDEILPPSQRTVDELAARSLALLEAEFCGAEVHRPDGHQWSIIVGDPQLVGRHPRGRTIYVHAIAALDEVGAHLSPDIQTVAVFPIAAAVSFRDQWARRGVARVVELGLNNVFRLGSAHDAMYPLQRMVRFVSCDMSARVHPKGITFDIGQTKILREERFLELVP